LLFPDSLALGVVIQLAKHFKCDDLKAIVSSLSEIDEFNAPIITYVGNINAEGTGFEVCAEGETLCRGLTLPKALQMLFVCYYIFDMKYAKKSRGTMLHAFSTDGCDEHATRKRDGPNWS
jgi:hypothetical protein